MGTVYVSNDLGPERKEILIAALRTFLEQNTGDCIMGTIDMGVEMGPVDEDNECIRITGTGAHFDLRLRKTNTFSW